jgi:molybdenum cofactor biosynthesis enzyme MoaA
MLQRAVSGDFVADAADDAALDALRDAYRPASVRYRPEESPFRVLFADITHRCNMACRNCYIPVRDLPDLPVDWLYAIVARLPRRTRIRLVGAEPTMRADLPEIIARVRRLGHIPVVLSNGLKLGRTSYVERLRAAGLGTVYLSLNGGLRDDLYEAIDGAPCAVRKLKALDNLIAARMHVTTGTILIPGVNDDHLADFLPWLLARGVRDIHFRSVGAMGRHMEDCSLSLDALEACVRRALGARAAALELAREEGASRDFRLGNAAIQLTQWPDLGSSERGRIAPDGYVEPMFESIVENAFHY